jgi:hypothetical protein
MAPFVGFSENEKDQEGDRETEETSRLSQRKAKKRKGLDLPLRRGIAGDRIDQCGEHIADADTGAYKRNAGETGSDHFGGS